MDGYRSENWFMADPSTTSEEVTTWWQGDSAHDDAMFSPYRSDIGAALAVGGDGQVYIVLETALQTNSGKMQSDAYPILTGIPLTQMAYSGMATQAAANGLLPQFLSPVKLSTPGPDGNLYHVAQYGQSLWSIAIAYHTTIKDIQLLNNLSDVTIREGQKLLVRRDVTQPALPANATQGAEIVPAPSFFAERSPVPERTSEPVTKESTASTIPIVAVAFAGLVLAGVFVGMMRTRDD
jgi:LysM repeat protein